MLTLFPVTSHKQKIVKIEAHSNEPTITYVYGIQQPIVPPSLNYLILPPDTIKILATMAVIQADPTQSDEDYSP